MLNFLSSPLRLLLVAGLQAVLLPAKTATPGVDNASSGGAFLARHIPVAHAGWLPANRARTPDGGSPYLAADAARCTTKNQLLIRSSSAGDKASGEPACPTVAGPAAQASTSGGAGGAGEG